MILFLASLFVGGAADAQMGPPLPTKGLSNELEQVYLKSSRFYHLKAKPEFQKLIERQSGAIASATKSLVDARLTSSRHTLAEPAITNEASLIADLEKTLNGCPMEIRDELMQKRPDFKLKLEVDPDPTQLAWCLRAFDILYSHFTHWNDLRIESNSKGLLDKQEEIDLRIYERALLNPTPENLKSACQVLATLGKARDEKISCDGNLTCDFIQAEYARLWTVLKKNPAVNFVREGDQLYLDLFVYETKVNREWMQKVIDQYWNVHPEFKIRVVDHSRKDNSLRLESRGAHTSGTTGIAGNTIGLDPRANQEEVFAHELGHVLGFRDCYIEFWEKKSKSVTYYELDRSNIMCAFTGKVLPLHIEALKQAYLSN